MKLRALIRALEKHLDKVNRRIFLLRRRARRKVL